jgi:geranylgeranyl diphosphate synthase type II
MNIEEYLQKQKAIVDRKLEEILPPEPAYPPKIHQAMRYSLFSGGKRVRPILCLASCEAVGGDPEPALPVACAIELVHTYSLIHDDLPAMDNDDLRRGKPTSHMVFGEAMAILAGDALLTLVYYVLSHHSLKTGIDSDIILKVIKEISRSAGTMGMIGGQVVDLESENQDIELPQLEYIHTHKTGALIRCSVVCGALLGGASADQMKRIRSYGEIIGLAFQIVDDILSIKREKSKNSKDIGSNLAQKKTTYPAHLGIVESTNRARSLFELALSELESFNYKADFLRDIVYYYSRLSTNSEI